jgi:KipI family sensor histidine kinase inhibitor
VDAVNEPRIQWSSERSVHLDCAYLCDPQRPARIAAAAAALRAAALPGVVEIVPAAESIGLEFAPGLVDADTLCARCATIAAEAAALTPEIAPQHAVHIPLCCSPDLAPDLAAVASHAGLQPAEVIERLAASDYTVRFCGFSPGFAYLAGLPAALAIPRRDTPRPRVTPGSFGIAGGTCGLYPQATPGGWQLVGATPARLFDPARSPPALLTPGDRVRLHIIDRADYERLARE